MTITSIVTTQQAERCQVSVVIAGASGSPNVVVIIDGKAYTAVLS